MTDEGQASELYLGHARASFGRALSMLDAEPGRPSYGCFDRTWWSWKFFDFPGARFQEGLFPLAFAVTSPMAAPETRGNTRLLSLAEAALEFWCGLQHGDGSFDEAYPFERSFAATAFSSLYIGMALERLRPHVSEKVSDKALATLERAAGWIAANGEQHSILSNHIAAGACALAVIGQLCGSDRWNAGVATHLATVYREQNRDEGWFCEYGGADPGYQSQGLSYLAELWSRTRDEELLERMRLAIEFDAWFANPDGTLGGEYCSRGTKFVFPYPFERLAGIVPAAASIASNIRSNLSAGRGLGLREMDSRNLFPLLANYLLAAENAGNAGDAGPLPWQRPGAEAFFPAAGLAVLRRGDRLLYTGLGSGGGLKLWDLGGKPATLLYEDSGFVVRARGRVLAASQGPSGWTRGQDGGPAVNLEVSATFSKVSVITMSPARHIAFRLFSLTLGRLPPLARFVKNRLVRILVLHRGRPEGGLLRRIRFGPSGDFQVDDEITGVSGVPQPVARFVPYHMGSARYVNLYDSAGARIAPPAAQPADGGEYRRQIVVSAQESAGS